MEEDNKENILINEDSNESIKSIEDNDYILKVENLSKLYGPEKRKAAELRKSGKNKDEVYRRTGSTIALWKNNLEIKEGEIFVIIGLSGSGKSTLIRCFNMLNKPSTGKILFKGRDVSKFSKKELNEFRRSKISMVFQQFGLMSHRSIRGNVEYGLEVKGVPKQERQEKANEMIAMVGLEDHEDEPISSLSGGMMQRVGIARALANDPEILLMDEPFSALDPLVRKDMQFELLEIQRKLNKTIVFITHDINEAFKIGDRVAIMKDGEIIQIDTPEEMSNNPADDYVKEFIDSADKAQVISVKNTMITPSAIVRLRENPSRAIKLMKTNGVSSAYVVAEKMKLQGIITIDGAIKANKESLKIEDVLIRDIKTTDPEALLSDVMPLAVEASFPIAVVDDDGRLKGIIAKSQVLSSII